jgi:hypothetical protein
VRRLASLSALALALEGCGGQEASTSPPAPPPWPTSKAAAGLAPPLPAGVAPPPPAAAAPAASVPVLVVDAQAVLLDGANVGDAAAITAKGKLSRLDGLFETLRHRAPFTPDISFEAKPGASTLAAASALETAGFAGYRTVHFAGTDVVARFVLPSHSEPSLHTVLRLRVEPEGIAFGWASDAPCAQAPRGGRVAPADLASAVAQGCGGKPCVDEAWIGVLADAPFENAVKGLRAASSSGTDSFGFTLSVAHERGPEIKDQCGEPVVTRLEPSAIQETIRAKFGDFRKCYESALARDPNARGRINTEIKIEPDGHVSEASIKDDSTFRDPAASKCILDGFRRLVFQRRLGGSTTVVYPIVFSPSG